MKLWVGLICALALSACKTGKTTGQGSEVLDLVNDQATQNEIASMKYLADEVYGHPCDPSGNFCMYFTPIDMPIWTLVKYLSEARSSIRIGIYSMSVPILANVLKERIQAGVRVEILHNFPSSFDQVVFNELIRDRDVASSANFTAYRTPTLRGSNPQMHNKIVIIDDKLVLSGSANYSVFGLVANFENTTLMTDPEVIRQYSAELDELRDHAEAFCEAFGSKGCGKGQNMDSGDWDKDMFDYVTKGKINPAIFQTDPKCEHWSKPGRFGMLPIMTETLQYRRKSFVNNQQVDVIASGDALPFRDCLLPQLTRYADFFDKVAEREQYTDGQATKDFPDNFGKTFNYPATQPIETYFSPEDNLSRVILKELDRLCAQFSGTGRARKCDQAKADAYFYGSLNFITLVDFSKKLIELAKAGVRVRVFFDRGRWNDPNFQLQRGDLERELFANDLLYVFDNDITSAYGAVHSKWAFIGAPSENYVASLTGSLNWSRTAVANNDENYQILRDPEVAKLFAREMLSQLLLYRDGGIVSSPKFQDDLQFLSRHLSGFGAMMQPGAQGACHAKHQTGNQWQPKLCSHVIFAMEKVPEQTGMNAWLWFKDTSSGKEAYVRMVTDDNFTHRTTNNKRWVTTVPLNLAATGKMKALLVPIGHDPNAHGVNDPRIVWEYANANDREVKAHAVAAALIEKTYVWGDPLASAQ